MSRESFDHTVCPVCFCTIYEGECACDNEQLAAYAEKQRVKRECEIALLRLGILPQSLAQKWEVV